LTLNRLFSVKLFLLEDVRLDLLGQSVSVNEMLGLIFKQELVQLFDFRILLDFVKLCVDQVPGELLNEVNWSALRLLIWEVLLDKARLFMGRVNR